MKQMKWFLLIFIFAQCCFAAEAPIDVSANSVVFTPAPKPLSFLTDITWASKYMLDGFKVAGDSPVWQIAFKTSLYDSGFSLMLWGAFQADRERKQFDETDFFIMYSKDFFKEQRYKLNFHGFYDYWIFPNTEPKIDEFGDVVSTAKRRGNKFQAGLSMPQLLPVADSFLIPSLNVYHWIYYDLDREDRNSSGTRYELLTEYDRGISLFIPRATYQYAGVTANVNYHTGVFGVDPGLSHAVATVRSGVYALKSIFEMSLNHQWTFNRTVNEEGNEFWSTMTFVKKF